MPRLSFQAYKELLDKRWNDLGGMIGLYQGSVMLGQHQDAARHRGDVHDAIDRLLDDINEQFKPR